jgi:Polyketide cyclase / dehydrase and lipid transport
VEEQVTERMIIRATPERCFDILTDFERYPDDRGRPGQVTFRAAAFGRSTSYTLAYDYHNAPKELSWVQVDGDITRRLDGAYTFEASGDDTEVVYRLTVELRVPLPGFVKRRAEGRIMGAALKELKARAEG